MIESSKPSIQIDLNEFKLHLRLKGRTQLTLHFNSPSRRFYLSVIALIVNEMKKLGKIKSIPLQGHLHLLALLNESIGGAAGSSDKEILLHRIYTKWKDALPNLEEAPLFKVLGRKKEGGEVASGKIYSFSEEEKDGWANLFEYMGSDENVRLKFAIDKIGVVLNETSIVFGDFRNGEAWDRFVASLKKEEKKEESGPVQETAPPEPPSVPSSFVQERRISWLCQYRWVLLIAVIGIAAGVIWKIFLSPAPIEVASVERMKYPLPDKPSIAVLPFVNLSKDPDQEYFTDGMVDDLITDLSKISDLLVIARNSTFTYKGKPAKVKQVAEELGVRYVLEGSVRRAGDEIRINAQLVDAMTGHHVWAERYDGSMKDVFTLQDRITRKIVSALAVKLTGTEKQTIEEKGTNNVEAYDAFLRGRIHYLRMTPDDLSKAIQSFKKSIELDPNYGRAYAALALTYWMGTYIPGVMKGLEVSWMEARLRAGQYLKLAMKKNPTAIAHQVNGLSYLLRRQHGEAISELERALVLDPNDPSIYQDMGVVLNFAGKPKEAIDFLNRGIRLDPHNPARYLIFLGVAQFCMGNLEEAANLIEKARRINPEMTGSFSYLAVIYGLLGRQKEARNALETYIKVWGGPANPSLSAIMYPFSFKDRAVADRFAEGMVKAGMAGLPSAYFPSFKENQLNGEEIKKLLLGSKITGISIGAGQQWWVERKKDGETTIRGPEPNSSDRGKSRVEGDLLCTQFQKSFWGIEYCMTVFRNPRGTYEGKDEYLNVTDFGFSPWSMAR